MDEVQETRVRTDTSEKLECRSLCTDGTRGIVYVRHMRQVWTMTLNIETVNVDSVQSNRDRQCPTNNALTRWW